MKGKKMNTKLMKLQISIRVLETKLLTDDTFVNKTYLTSKTIRKYMPFEFRKEYDKFDRETQETFIYAVNGHISNLKLELLNTLESYKA
jgi:hypothetical protein